MAMNDPAARERGAELLASLRAVLAELERVERPPTNADTSTIRKALQMLDTLVATAGATRGGELPPDSFNRLSTARRSLNQVFVAPKYLRAAETTLRQVLATWASYWEVEQPSE